MVHLGWDAFWKVIAMSDTPCKGPGKPWTALWFWYIFGFGWIIPSCLLPSRLPPSCGNLLLTAAKRVNSLACSACPVTTTLLTNCLWSPKQSLRTWRTCACCLLVTDELESNCAVWDSYCQLVLPLHGQLAPGVEHVALLTLGDNMQGCQDGRVACLRQKDASVWLTAKYIVCPRWWLSGVCCSACTCVFQMSVLVIGASICHTFTCNCW